MVENRAIASGNGRKVLLREHQLRLLGKLETIYELVNRSRGRSRGSRCFLTPLLPKNRLECFATCELARAHLDSIQGMSVRMAVASMSARDMRPALAMASRSSIWTICNSRSTPRAPNAPRPQRAARPRHTASAPQCQRFEDVGPTAEATVDEHGYGSVHLGDDFPQHLEGRRNIVQGSSAVIGYDDAVESAVDTKTRVFGSQDALDEHGDVDESPDLVEIFPVVPKPSGHGQPVKLGAARRGLFVLFIVRDPFARRVSTKMAVVEIALEPRRLLIDGNNDRLRPRRLKLLEPPPGQHQIRGRIELDPARAVCGRGDFLLRHARTVRDDHGHAGGCRAAIGSRLGIGMKMVVPRARRNHQRRVHLETENRGRRIDRLRAHAAARNDIDPIEHLAVSPDGPFRIAAMSHVVVQPQRHVGEANRLEVESRHHLAEPGHATVSLQGSRVQLREDPR